jgi:hypothetical protein
MSNLQRESREPYAPPTSVTWQKLLRKQTKTDAYTTLAEETRLSTRTVLSRDIIQDSLILPAPEAGEFDK